MSSDWASSQRSDLSSDGSDSKPVVTDFFKGFSSNALGQLRLWLDDELRKCCKHAPGGVG